MANGPIIKGSFFFFTIECFVCYHYLLNILGVLHLANYFSYKAHLSQLVCFNLMNEKLYHNFAYHSLTN